MDSVARFRPAVSCVAIGQVALGGLADVCRQVLSFPLIMCVIGTSRAADPPSGVASHAAPTESRNAALEKAFADAHLEVIARYQQVSYLGKLWATKPLPPPSVMAANFGMGSLDWQSPCHRSRGGSHANWQQKTGGRWVFICGTPRRTRQ